MTQQGYRSPWSRGVGKPWSPCASPSPPSATTPTPDFSTHQATISAYTKRIPSASLQLNPKQKLGLIPVAAISQKPAFRVSDSLCLGPAISAVATCEVCVRITAQP